VSSPACELCERAVPRLTKHHLFPKSVGRRKGRPVDELPTAELCGACHRQVHALFENRELAKRLDSLEALRAEPRMQSFLTWVKKQPAERAIRVRR